MTGTLLVTGGTGLTGSTIAVLASKSRPVRVLVRGNHDLEPLAELGIEVFRGDITDPASLAAAFDGVEDVIHAAGALGGTWSSATPDELWAVNYDGAANVLDAAARAGIRRTVVIDSFSVMDTQFTVTETSPMLPISPENSAYVRAKRAIFYAAMHRSAIGQDVVVVTPGAIYGPGVLVERALEETSFTRMLQRAIRGELESYVKFPMLWTYVGDLAETCLRALSEGRIGRRYLSMGRGDEVATTADFCNEAAEIAGVSARVIEIDPADPDAPDVGPMRAFAERVYADPIFDASVTERELGVTPIARTEGLRQTVDWLRSVGEL